MFDAGQNTVERRKLSEQVYDIIKRMILSGELMPGQKIPEESIAASLNVSRTPIREALQKLQQVGIVEIVPRSYAKVVQLNPEDKKHIGQVRLQLELLTARLLSENATEEDCEVFRSISDECVSLAERGDKAAVYEKHSDLHLEMARRTGNPYLYEMMKSIDVKVQLLRVAGYVKTEEILENLTFHPQILDAISRHDRIRAEQLMQQHLKRFYFNRR